MRKVEMSYYRKNGRNFEKTFYTDNRADVYERLTAYLIARYINKAAWARRVSYRSNYDGTYTTVIYEDNGNKAVFVTER